MKEIKQIIQLYDLLKSSSIDMALASIVYTEESSYRRVGARMLVSAHGEWTGGISGGCLEGDALHKSQAAIHNKVSSIVRYDTTDDDENQIGIGLGCNGVIDVLFTPIDIKDENNEIEQLKAIVDKRSPSILIKIIHSDNMHHVGQSRIISDEDEDINFVNIPDSLLQENVRTLSLRKKSSIIEYQEGDNSKGRFLIEYIQPQTHIVIVGDNYDAIALSAVASEMGWLITVIGRIRKMSKQLTSHATYIYEYEEWDKVTIDAYTAVVLMTHDYARDVAILPKILNTKPVYLGILGPKKRFIKLSDDIGICHHNTSHTIHAPIGLDIGADNPEEIAISIIAEILAVQRERKGESLRNRHTPIHKR